MQNKKSDQQENPHISNQQEDLNISDQTKDHKVVNIFSELKEILLAIVIVMILKTFVFSVYYVPTGSMKNTILAGDYLFATHYDYGFSKHSLPFSLNLFQGRLFDTTPKRGDVIIMRTPKHIQEDYFIKRLIGLPGDKIEIINGATYINDKQVQRKLVAIVSFEDGNQYEKYKEILPNNCQFFSYHIKNRNRYTIENLNYGPHIVKENHYFFMGDNRDGSGDSRFNLGDVHFDLLVSQARCIIWSFAEPLWNSSLGISDQIKRISKWATSIRWNRFFKKMYYTKSFF